MNDTVRALAVFDDGFGGGPAPYAGGDFGASPAGDSYLAKWQGCPSDPDCPTGDLNGDCIVNEEDLLILLDNWETVRR